LQRRPPSGPHTGHGNAVPSHLMSEHLPEQHPSSTTNNGPRTVAVAGATGFVGQHIIRALTDAGHHVRAMVRDPEKASKVLPAGVEHVRAERIGPESAEALAEGCDTFIYLIGIIREAPTEGKRFGLLHVDGVRWSLEACKQAGATRFLHMSALGADPEGRAEYQRSKFKGEQLVRASGLDWTIFRPSLIHGPGGEFTKMMADWARGSIPPWFTMPYFERRADGRWSLVPAETVAPRIQPVTVEDVASAFVGSINNEQSFGEVYNLAGSEVLEWPEMLEFVRDRVPHANKSIRANPVPAPPAWATANVMDFIGLGGLMPFDAGMAAMGSEDSTASTVKANADLGLEPAPFRESFAKYAAAL